jgi:hypothetical protein
MIRTVCRFLVFGWLLFSAFALFSQVIRNEYVDLTVPGEWQPATNLNVPVAGAGILLRRQERIAGPD